MLSPVRLSVVCNARAVYLQTRHVITAAINYCTAHARRAGSDTHRLAGSPSRASYTACARGTWPIKHIITEVLRQQTTTYSSHKFQFKLHVNGNIHCQSPFTRYNRLDVCLHDAAGSPTGCTTESRLSNRFDNRFDNRLYRVNGA